MIFLNKLLPTKSRFTSGCVCLFICLSPLFICQPLEGLHDLFLLLIGWMAKFEGIVPIESISPCLTSLCLFSAACHTIVMSWQCCLCGCVCVFICLSDWLRGNAMCLCNNLSGISPCLASLCLLERGWLAVGHPFVISWSVIQWLISACWSFFAFRRSEVHQCLLHYFIYI